MKHRLILLCMIVVQVGTAKLWSQTVSDVISEYESVIYAETDKTYWPNLNEKYLHNRQMVFQQLRMKLDAVLISGENPQDIINKDLLQLILDDKIYNLKFKTHQIPLSAEGGFITGMLYSFDRMDLSDANIQSKYIKKLNALPAYIDSRMSHMKSGQAAGKSSPKLITDLCVGILKSNIDVPVAELFFVAPSIGTPIEEKVKAIAEKSVLPALKKLNKYLSGEYWNNAPEEIGISKISDGKAYYEQRIRYYATDNITPEQVFDIGLSEVDRIRAEMDSIISVLDYEGDFKSFCAFLRTDPQFYAKSPKEILHYAAWITKEMEGKLPQYIGKLPSMPLTVKPVPAAIAENYTTGRYSSGSYEDQRAGEYWVNTTKLESRPLYVLPSLSLHEGVPGHHTQIMLAAELDLPKFRKNQYLSAFGEGWALYCEYLGKEAGMYHTPYEDFGRLVYEMWRACRLVVDPGMHYMGWTRDQAFQFMKDNTALSLHEIGTEINRYIGWPGQAVSYKLGELKIRSLRKTAEERLGEHFDIRSFHDKVLENGSIPMQSLEQVVQDWMTAVLQED